jgi:hypothetical protein
MVGAISILIIMIMQYTTADVNIKTMKINVNELLHRVRIEMDQVCAAHPDNLDDLQKTKEAILDLICRAEEEVSCYDFSYPYILGLSLAFLPMDEINTKLNKEYQDHPCKKTFERMVEYLVINVVDNFSFIMKKEKLENIRVWIQLKLI